MTDNDRLHALDAVRGAALLLGLVLHSTMSFILPIPVADNSPSTTLAVIFYVIHIFRMIVFYFIAGFFARMVFHRRGLRHFVRDRAKRIGIPLVAGWIFIAPPTIAIVIWGLISTFGLETLQNTSDQSQGGFPWTHLWFLYYLCIFYLLALILQWIVSRVIDRSGGFRALIDKLVFMAVRFNFIPVLLAVPICLLLYSSDSWILWAGIPTPDTGITPQAAAMTGFGTAFGIGWIMQRQVSILNIFKKFWPLNLMIAVALTAYCLSLVGLKLEIVIPPEDAVIQTALSLGPGSQIAPGWSRFSYAAGYTMAIWFWTLAIVGSALSYCSGLSFRRRYLADSSYWLYLIHLPIIFFLQVLMARWPLHWSIKFSAILATTTAIGLVSYHYLVRATFIGKLLNGRRYPKERRSSIPSTAIPSK